MNIKLWLAGAVSAAAVTTGFAATAPAATAATHPAVRTPAAAPFLTGQRPLTRIPAETIDGSAAGYIALADKNVRERYVAASFNVPSLNCAGDTDGGVVQGAALDGAGTPYQLTGVVETCNADGTYNVEGFYQINAQNFPPTNGATVSAGDAMTASVYYNTSTKQYTFTLADVTTGQTIVDATAACPSGASCPDDSAEAISTYTGLPGGGTAPLADYGMENFTGGAVTSFSGTKGSFSTNKLWTSEAVIINDGTTLASLTSLAGGSAFATIWHASN